MGTVSYTHLDVYKRQVLAGVTALGLGQALLTAPTLALIPEICERECQRFGQATVLSALRVIERIGSVAGLSLIHI